LLLILTITLFIFILVKEDKKPIKIEPIKIENPSVTQKLSSKEPEKEKPVDILSKLKVATKVSTEGIVPSKEEVSNKVLASLKESIEEQEIEEPVVAKPIVKKPIVKKTIVKKVVAKRAVPKKVVQKKVVHQKVVHKKNVHKKVATKKEIKKHLISKKVKVATNIKKKNIKEPLQVVKNPTKIVRRESSLSREEEVALYHQKYSSGLEVVKVTKPFVIKEEKTVPDSHYFEPQKPVEPTNPNPTKFVKTLGVVAVSKAYETPLVVPKKVEVAKEGIVEFPNAKLETEELKKLKFVKPLEVVEVSKPFETIEAKKYLK